MNYHLSNNKNKFIRSAILHSKDLAMWYHAACVTGRKRIRNGGKRSVIEMLVIFEDVKTYNGVKHLSIVEDFFHNCFDYMVDLRPNISFNGRQY